MPNNFLTPKNLRWITVYLFLGLLVLLLALNLVALPANGSTTKPGTPTANSTHTHTLAPTPSPTIDVASMLGLTQATSIIITGIDPVALSAASQGGTLSTNSQSAVTSLEKKIMDKITSLRLNNQQAAIAIVYGGVKDTSKKINQGEAVAKEVYLVLRMLGKGQGQPQPFVFCHTSYGKALTTSDQISSVVVIDIYFFDPSYGAC